MVLVDRRMHWHIFWCLEALDVLLQGLSWLLLEVAQVTHGRRAVASALKDGEEAVAHLVPGGDGAWE